MQEVFEKIIEQLEELKKAEIEREDLRDEEGSVDGEAIYEDGKSQGRFEQVVRIIEIVKQASEECKHGHFGCNSNGQHEKCSTCCDYDCKNRNREWFGVKDNDNGWIPCSEPPKTRVYVLLSFSNFSVPIVGRYEENKQGGAYYIGDEDETCIQQDMFVNAWQPLPAPYQPKGE